MRKEERGNEKNGKRVNEGEGYYMIFLLGVERRRNEMTLKASFIMNGVIQYNVIDMKVDLVVSRKVERLYKEYMALVDELKAKTKEERVELYDSMTKTLFPHATKMVDLEDQLNEERKDYQRKFKEWFLVICKWSFSGAHFGETCFNLYKKES